MEPRQRSHPLPGFLLKGRPAFLLGGVVLTLLVCCNCPTIAGERPTVCSPVERSGFVHITSYDSLQVFLTEIGKSPSICIDQIATTRNGRAVNLVRVSIPQQAGTGDRLRILLFAQQHGDEPAGKEALTALLARCASGMLDSLLSKVELFIVPLMNPDGAELRQRRTSDGTDLNRNHLVLTSPETRALHELFFEFRPEVTLDLHEYGSFSKSWSDSGFIKRGDVQLGMLTNLNSSPVLRKYEREAVYPFIAQRMAASGYSFHEYIVGSPTDYVRHSTTEINDGRQSFGILNTLSFIQEGRQWKTIADSLKRRTLAQLTSIEGLLAFCAMHAEEIKHLVDGERRILPGYTGKSFVLRMEHFPEAGRMQIPVTLVPSGKDSLWTITPYRNVVRPLTLTNVPRQYLVPREASGILDVVGRHHITTEIVTKERTAEATVFTIDSVGTEVVEEDSLPRLFVNERRVQVMLRPGDVLIPTSQWQSLLIATMLEPTSVWGLTKYPSFAWLLRERQYPVFRIQ
jgi:hypothetical protein